MVGTAGQERLTIVACGALAHELVALRKANGWQHVRIQCLPAELHNRPEQIPERVDALLDACERAGERAFVAYADCGTGGRLDQVLARRGTERLPGAHCYEFFAGSVAFAELADEEVGSFYLTDFLARHFERLILRGLGIDRHPELASMYFGNYRRIVYLAQRRDADLEARARAAADALGLAYEYRFTGLDGMGVAVSLAVDGPVRAAS